MQARHRLGTLRHRLRPAPGAKGDAELAWWLQHWDPVLREGGLFGVRALELSGDATVADTYLGRRWQQARAEVARVRWEARLEDPGFFAGKRVVDIGPACMGFPDGVAEQAAASVGVEPLAERFAAAGLLLDSPAVYLPCGAERVPLRSAWADVVCARNSLDHVEDPEAVVVEARRLLRPGGVLVVNVDLGHTPTVTEPHAIALADLRRWVKPLVIEREVPHEAHGEDGRAVVLVARR